MEITLFITLLALAPNSFWAQSAPNPNEVGHTASTPKKTSSNVLTECIRSNMVDKYADARNVGSNHCRKEVDAWFIACQNGALDATSRLRCDQELRELVLPIDKEWKVSHPDPPQPQDPKLVNALQDLKNGRDLPEMPNLNKAVFLVKGSVICSSPGALGNPNRDLVLFTGACAATSRDVRVSVLPPSDAQEYLRDHYFGIVAIT